MPIKVSAHQFSLARILSHPISFHRKFTVSLLIAITQPSS